MALSTKRKRDIITHSNSYKFHLYPRTKYLGKHDNQKHHSKIWRERSARHNKKKNNTLLIKPEITLEELEDL